MIYCDKQQETKKAMEEPSFENWGYTKDVFVCDMEIPVPKMESPSDLRVFQLELMQEVLRLFEGFHILTSVEYDKTCYEKLHGIWTETVYFEDWKKEAGSQFVLMNEIGENAFFPVIVADLATTIFQDGEERLVSSSAEFLLSTDPNWEYISSGKSSIKLSYHMHIDVWLNETLDIERKHRDNSIDSKKNAARLQEVVAKLCERFPKMNVTSRYYSENLKEFGFSNND